MVCPLKIYKTVAVNNDTHIQQMNSACDAAESVLHVFEAACPGDNRPRAAIAAGRQWAKGKLSVGDARKAAFASHAAAREAKDADCLSAEKAARSAGHAAATAHVVGHARHAVDYAQKALENAAKEQISPISQ